MLPRRGFKLQGFPEMPGIVCMSLLVSRQCDAEQSMVTCGHSGNSEIVFLLPLHVLHWNMLHGVPGL